MTTQHDGLFFERQLEGETAHQFQAFCTYRDMGITRSLKRAAQVFYADGGPGYGSQEATEGLPDSGGAAQLTRFKNWSREHAWVARVEAFDAEETRSRSLLMKQRREEMVEDHLKLVRLGLNVASKSLFDIARGEDFLPSGVLPQLVTSITTLHRLTLGEATDRLETATIDAHQHQPDYSALSDEELDFLDEIGRKLYGSLD